MRNQVVVFSLVIGLLVGGVATAWAQQKPQDIPPKDGLVLWLDAAETANVLLNGASVSEWRDRSGQNRIAVQKVAAQQPLYVKNALNDKPAIRFDGMRSFLNLGNPPDDLYTDYTVISVWQSMDSGKQRAIWSNRHLEAPAGGTLTYYGHTAGSLFVFQNNASAMADYGKVKIPANEVGVNMLLVSDSGQTRALYLNGMRESVTTKLKSLATKATSGFLGYDAANGEYFTGALAEYLVYRRALSDAERQILEGYLAQKYGFAATLPNGHPGKKPASPAH
ncbi:MAG: LamG-like jellyroll fold domain-containing protein [Armatimonadota bacterium]